MCCCKRRNMWINVTAAFYVGMKYISRKKYYTKSVYAKNILQQLIFTIQYWAIFFWGLVVHPINEDLHMTRLIPDSLSPGPPGLMS